MYENVEMPSGLCGYAGCDGHNNSCTIKWLLSDAYVIDSVARRNARNPKGPTSCSRGFPSLGTEALSPIMLNIRGVRPSMSVC